MSRLLKGIFGAGSDYDTCAPYKYPEFDRTPEDAPRYTPSDDGWWRRTDAESTGEAVLCCVGDLMGEPKLQRANKYGDAFFMHPCFRFVRDIMRSSDFAVGNLETTVTDKSPYACEAHIIEGKYHCNSPEAYLDALRYAGFDALVNANNHNCDSRADGLIGTISALERHGFMHTGTFAAPDAERAVLAEVNGIRLAVLSYATYFNKNDGCFTPLGRKTLLNRYSADKAKKDIDYARKKGAEFVLVYMHWGTEYTHEPNDSQRRMAKELADCGVDYIVGSHTHCLQAREFVESADGRTVPVVYSMGNFLTSETKEISRHTGILRLTLKKSDGGIAVAESFIPCYVYKQYDASRYAPVPTTRETSYKSDRELLARVDKYARDVMCIEEPVTVN